MNPFHKSWFVYLKPLKIPLRKFNSLVNMESGSVISTSGYWKVFFCSLIILRLLKSGHSFNHFLVSLVKHAKSRSVRARSKYFPRLWQLLFSVSFIFLMFKRQRETTLPPAVIPASVPWQHILHKKEHLAIENEQKPWNVFWWENWPLNSVVNISDLFRKRFII